MDKHHYVPKIYLRQFTKKLDGHFFGAGPKPDLLRTIKNRHIEEVCYLDNFYTLNKSESLKRYSLEDKNYIEKNAFNYEKSKIRQVFNKFKNKNVNLTRSYHEQLIDIYISIKMRNVFIRKSYLDTGIMNQTLDREVANFRVMKSWIESVSGENYDTLMNRAKETLLNDTELHEEFQKQSILETLRGTNVAVNSAKDKIQKLKLYILEPLDSKDYFLTSDNPGFTILGNKVYNTNFGKFDGIGFPINSKQLIWLSGKSDQSRLDILTRINYRKLTTKEVDRLNFCTTFNSYKYIYSESKKYLTDYVERYLAEHGSKQNISTVVD
ncbi:MAG: DUF4238 domain-containing protein [Cyclobacteriaceae bacterium]|nr:MAG: DUF4238 domain-containing protein [Cyclobacteriaceae bacterium]